MYSESTGAQNANKINWLCVPSIKNINDIVASIGMMMYVCVSQAIQYKIQC